MDGKLAVLALALALLPGAPASAAPVAAPGEVCVGFPESGYEPTCVAVPAVDCPAVGYLALPCPR